jgi:TorA maturation chaperone TorD
LHYLVGMADLCELLASAFSFPSPELSDAFSDGNFLADWSASWTDATHVEFNYESKSFPGFKDVKCDALRKEYSRLYLLPGNQVPVWPYENCFVFRAKGRQGTPSLFRSPTLIDVESRMRDAGVLPADVRTEPADTMFKEFAFLSYLYGKAAEAHDTALRQGGNASDVEAWHQRAIDFAQAHALAWLPGFMDQTALLTRLDTYRSLAHLGSSFMGLLERDVAAAKVGDQ